MKKHNLVHDPHYKNRLWIVLEVTSKDIKQGVQVDKPGLYAFGGLWNGSRPHRHRSYGKVIPLNDKMKVVRNDIFGMSLKELKKIL